MWLLLEEKESGRMLGLRRCWIIFGEEDINVIIAVGSLEAVFEDIEDEWDSIIPLIHLLLFIGELLHLLLTTVSKGGIKINQIHLSFDPPKLLLMLSIMIMRIEPTDRSPKDSPIFPIILDHLNLTWSFIKYYKYIKDRHRTHTFLEKNGIQESSALMIYYYIV